MMSPAIAFDGEVFVDGADDDAFGLRDHGEQSGLGNGAAAGDGRQAAPRRARSLRFTRSRWM